MPNPPQSCAPLSSEGGKAMCHVLCAMCYICAMGEAECSIKSETFVHTNIKENIKTVLARLGWNATLCWFRLGAVTQCSAVQWMQRSAAAQCSVYMQLSKLQKSGTMCVRRQERAGKETTRGQSHEILRYADLKPGAAIQCRVVQCSAV